MAVPVEGAAAANGKDALSRISRKSITTSVRGSPPLSRGDGRYAGLGAFGAVHSKADVRLQQLAVHDGSLQLAPDMGVGEVQRVDGHHGGEDGAGVHAGLCKCKNLLWK